SRAVTAEAPEPAADRVGPDPKPGGVKPFLYLRHGSLPGSGVHEPGDGTILATAVQAQPLNESVCLLCQLGAIAIAEAGHDRRSRHQIRAHVSRAPPCSRATPYPSIPH